MKKGLKGIFVTAAITATLFTAMPVATPVAHAGIDWGNVLGIIFGAPQIVETIVVPVAVIANRAWGTYPTKSMPIPIPTTMKSCFCWLLRKMI